MLLLLLQGATTVVSTPGPAGLTPLVPGDTTILLATSGASVLIIQWLKNSRWFKGLSPSSKTMNRLASIFAALLSATGIHFTFNAGTLVISGLALSTLVPAVVGWIKSFVLNELIYMGVQIKNQTAATGQAVGAPSPPTPAPSVATGLAK
jgi:hypothetical protein